MTQYANNELTRLLHLNKISKSPILKLSDINLVEFPDLSELTWITDLDVSKNFVTSIRHQLLPPNLTRLDLSHNKIVYFINVIIPKTLVFLYLNNNQLISFNGRQYESIKYLDVSNNGINYITFPPNLEHAIINNNKLTRSPSQNLPSTLITLDLGKNKLTDVPNFNSNLKTLLLNDNELSRALFISLPLMLSTLDLSNNELTKFPNLNINLKTLLLSGNNLDEIPKITVQLEKLDISNNISIYELVNPLPPTLIHLDASTCFIDKITSILPIGLEHLNLSHNELKEMPELPNNIKYVDVSSNNITAISEIIPESLTELNISGNQLETQENLMYKTNLKVINLPRISINGTRNVEYNTTYPLSGYKKKNNKNKHKNFNNTYFTSNKTEWANDNYTPIVTPTKNQSLCISQHFTKHYDV